MDTIDFSGVKFIKKHNHVYGNLKFARFTKRVLELENLEDKEWFKSIRNNNATYMHFHATPDKYNVQHAIDAITYKLKIDLSNKPFDDDTLNELYKESLDKVVTLSQDILDYKLEEGDVVVITNNTNTIFVDIINVLDLMVKLTKIS